MDSELLKDRETDVILTQKLPKCGELLMYLRCASYKHSSDPVIIEIKKNLAERLAPIMGVCALPMNMPLASLNFMLRAIYYACTTPSTPPPGLLGQLTDIIDKWKNKCLLKLGDEEEEEFGAILNDFARLYSYVYVPLEDMVGKVGEGFVCPMCILNTIYTGIGWTDIVCPKPAESASCTQRGVDKGYPVGFCRHIVSYHKTFFDNVLWNEHHGVSSHNAR